MPIANCFITDELPPRTEVDELTSRWAAESGVGDEQMTINLVASTRQAGSDYRVMAFLYLPSLWRADQVRELQLGLASALTRGLGVDPSEVQVVTSIVEPGHVVESGRIEEW